MSLGEEDAVNVGRGKLPGRVDRVQQHPFGEWEWHETELRSEAAVNPLDLAVNNIVPGLIGEVVPPPLEPERVQEINMAGLMHQKKCEGTEGVRFGLIP